MNAPLSIELASVFDRHKHVFLAFSGGKESVVLAHLCEPWRERVTLLWVNTGAGVTLPHMVEFVRRYGERFNLVELASPNVMQSWQDFGLPVDVLPVANAIGEKFPRLQPWRMCCTRIRNMPIAAHLSQFPGAAVLAGQRLQDNAFVHVQAMKAIAPDVEHVFPLWDWTTADVLRYVERHGLELPHQYAHGFRDSGECGICHAALSAERLNYLDSHYPEMAATVRQNAAGALLEAQAALDQTATILGLPARRL